MSDDMNSLGVIAAVVFGDTNELLIGMIIARIASIVRMDELDIEIFTSTGVIVVTPEGGIRLDVWRILPQSVPHQQNEPDQRLLCRFAARMEEASVSRRASRACSLDIAMLIARRIVGRSIKEIVNVV